MVYVVFILAIHCLFSSLYSSQEEHKPVVVTQFIPQKPEKIFFEFKDTEKKSEIELEDTMVFNLKRGNICNKIIPSMKGCHCAQCKKTVGKDFIKIKCFND